MLQAVAYLHRVCQRLHLDLRTDNILMSEAREQLFVADLGSSQVIERSQEADTARPPS